MLGRHRRKVSEGHSREVFFSRTRCYLYIRRHLREDNDSEGESSLACVILTLTAPALCPFLVMSSALHSIPLLRQHQTSCLWGWSLDHLAAAWVAVRPAGCTKDGLPHLVSPRERLQDAVTPLFSPLRTISSGKSLTRWRQLDPVFPSARAEQISNQLLYLLYSLTKREYSVLSYRGTAGVNPSCTGVHRLWWWNMLSQQKRPVTPSIASPGRQGLGPEDLSRTRCADGRRSPSVVRKHPHKTGATCTHGPDLGVCRRRISAPRAGATRCGGAEISGCRIFRKCTILDSAQLSADNDLTLSYSGRLAALRLG